MESLPNAVRVLALEPYYGGSHRAFLDGWARRSRHHWTTLSLPARHWKWRMRHAPLTLAEQVRERTERGERWDLLWCSDMLNLAEFRGLAPAPVARIPAVAYFHENQLTYPDRVGGDRDHHFAFSNLMTALAADQVWFNSGFHRDAFLSGFRSFLQRMPDFRPLPGVDKIAARSRVFPPGVEAFPAPATRPPGPLRVLWAARWEHDKNPETFFAALERLESLGVDFQIDVIGESYRRMPEVFPASRARWPDRIGRWGFQDRAGYAAALREADAFVSTANHEFFGIAAVEAMTAGAYPLLPRRLAYPELLEFADRPVMSQFFYDGSAEQLAGRLQEVSRLRDDPNQWRAAIDLVRSAVARFAWPTAVERMDAALQLVALQRAAARVDSAHDAN